jgi:hypothetical protein
MKTCAVRAMLVGGTFVSASAAQAGLTWHGTTVDQYTAQRTLTVADTFPPADAYQSVEGDDAYGASTFTDAAHLGSSVTFSGLTPSGPNENSWSVTGTTTAFGQRASFSTSGFYFTVTDGQEVTIATSQWASWYLYGTTDPNTPYYDLIGYYEGHFDPISNSQTFNLSAGEYQFYGDATIGNGYSGTLMSFTVPAPGAMALLGAAGLVGARRRRA